MIAKGKTDPVALVLIPGPWTNTRDYNLEESIILDMAVDFRGKEIDPLREAQIREAATQIRNTGLSRVAGVGKFCQRNHSHELKAGEILAAGLPGARIELGYWSQDTCLLFIERQGDGKPGLRKAFDYQSS